MAPGGEPLLGGTQERLGREGEGDSHAWAVSAHQVGAAERALGEGFGDHAYDLIVSNPPYVGADEIESLQPEVRDWEPRLATVGETHTRRIAEHACAGLRPRGHLVLEVAEKRGADVAALLEELGYEDVMTTEDLAGRDRVVEGRRP